MLLGWTDVVLH